MKKNCVYFVSLWSFTQGIIHFVCMNDWLVVDGWMGDWLTRWMDGWGGDKTCIFHYWITFVTQVWNMCYNVLKSICFMEIKDWMHGFSILPAIKIFPFTRLPVCLSVLLYLCPSFTSNLLYNMIPHRPLIIRADGFPSFSGNQSTAA
jgi:hypothetical protein